MEAAFTRSRVVKPVNILIVEDSSADAAIMALVFRESGYPVKLHIVVDGDEALDFLFQHGRFTEAPRPQIIFLDIHLPKRSGLEVLEQININSHLASIPVYILSTSASAADRQRSQDLNAKRFITKPEDLPGFQHLMQYLVTVEFPTLTA